MLIKSSTSGHYYFFSQWYLNICHAHQSRNKLDSIERVYIFPRIWSLSPYHKLSSQMFHRLSKIFSLLLYCAHIEKRRNNKKNSPFLAFGFLALRERKPLIKTFLVCGILLLDPEVENSFPHILQNLLSIFPSYSLFFLKFVLQMFLFSPFLTIVSGFFFLFSFLFSPRAISYRIC